MPPKAISPIQNKVLLAANFAASLPASTMKLFTNRVLPGNASSSDLESLKAVLVATLQMLGLSGEQKEKGQLLIRLDGGFGTTSILEHLLTEGYQFIVKLHSANRSKKLAHCLEESQWFCDHNSLRWPTLLGENRPLRRPLRISGGQP